MAAKKKAEAEQGNNQRMSKKRRLEEEDERSKPRIRKPLTKPVKKVFWTATQLRDMSPIVYGIRISQEKKYNARWRVIYGNLKTNNELSAGFKGDDPETQKQAQIACLRFPGESQLALMFFRSCAPFLQRVCFWFAVIIIHPMIVRNHVQGSCGHAIIEIPGRTPAHGTSRQWQPDTGAKKATR
jgi:hypothetical protein